MRYSLRPARIDDLEPMMAIGHEGIRPYVEAVRGWDEAEEERGFAAHFVPDLISIILVDGREVGYIKLEDRGDHIYLDGIYLDETHRSQGLGRDIIGGVLSDAHADGKRVRLRVLKPNPARRLYERLGFREVGGDRDHFDMEA